MPKLTSSTVEAMAKTFFREVASQKTIKKKLQDEGHKSKSAYNLSYFKFRRWKTAKSREFMKPESEMTPKAS